MEPDNTSSEHPTAQSPASRLVAILYADAAGYSAAMSRDELAAIGDIREALDQFAQGIGLHRGQTLNLAGDGVLAVFESVAAAVGFALSIQRSFAGRGRDATDQRLGFRIAVHLGEVFEEPGNAHGNSLNLAERIQRITPVGGVCVSDAVYRAIRGRPEFGFEFLGPQALRGIPDPVDVYRIHGTGVAIAMRATVRANAAPRSAARNRLEELERPSIAVLPFRSAGAEGDRAHFADGVADDIITALTRFRGLDVIARGSSFALRDQSLAVPEIGRRLGARYVAQGSIRHAGARVRVTVELADAATERTVWAERYDRPLEDIFAIQDEIVELTVGTMAVRIEQSERERARVAPPGSLDAYGLVLEGQNRIVNFTRDDNTASRRCFERALDASPGYARAFASLSRTHSLDWRYNWTDDATGGLERAVDVASRAITADPNDARGHAELGYALLYCKEHDRSLASYRRAVSFNPNDANIIAGMADAMTHSGHSDESLDLFRKAIRLNPFHPDQYLWDMAGALFKLSRFEESIECVYRMHNVTQGRRLLAASFAHLGRLDEARREAEQIRAAQPGFSAEHWVQIVPDRRPEDVELFISGLKKAGL